MAFVTSWLTLSLSVWWGNVKRGGLHTFAQTFDWFFTGFWQWSVHYTNNIVHCLKYILIYKGRLQSLWTHLITPSWNFMEVRWWSLLEVPPLASNELLTMLHPLLKDVLQTIDHLEISYLGAPFSWLEKPRKITWGEIWTVWQML
jgi:hypothetical protein